MSGKWKVAIYMRVSRESGLEEAAPKPVDVGDYVPVLSAREILRSNIDRLRVSVGLRKAAGDGRLICVK